MAKYRGERGYSVLNCDVQTVFTDNLCIEYCVDICPMDCISFVNNDEEEALRQADRAIVKIKICMCGSADRAVAVKDGMFALWTVC